MVHVFQLTTERSRAIRWTVSFKDMLTRGETASKKLSKEKKTILRGAFSDKKNLTFAQQSPHLLWIFERGANILLKVTTIVANIMGDT